MSISQCERLDDYLLGGLLEDERAAFEAHLSGCPACREELQQQEHIDRLLAQGAERLEPVPSSLIARIDEEFRRSNHRRNHRRVVRWAWGLSTAVLLLLGLTVWLAMGVLDTNNDRRPTVQEDIVQQRPEPSGDPEQPDLPPHETRRTAPVASVSFADPSDVIQVHVDTKTPN
ncbi:MAG: anti-sigma factor family protein, partial [Planctomycetota bacterium]